MGILLSDLKYMTPLRIPEARQCCSQATGHDWPTDRRSLMWSCLIRTSPGGHSQVRGSRGSSRGGERSAVEPGRGLT